MKKLLLTGASGFLGRYVAQNTPPDWRTIGIFNENAGRLQSKQEAVQLDLTNRDATWQTLKATSPDAVFHLAAASSPAFCEENPTATREINVEATTWLAEMCAERHCRFLFTSSEQVYDGLAAPYNETGTPTPKNEYGCQKLAAEQAVKAISTASVIARMAAMFGQEGDGTKNFLSQWLEIWQRGEAVTAFHDEIRSFLSGPAAASALFLLLEKGAEGIFNIGGADAISRSDFAQIIAKAHRLPEAKIIKKSQQDLENATYRPANLTLDLSKIKDLGFRPQRIAACF